MHYNRAVEVLRAGIKGVMDTLSTSEWKTAEEREALDAMEAAFNDTATLEVDNATMMVANIREILWPDGDPEHPWSPDTIEQVAEVLDPWTPPTLTPEQIALETDVNNVSTEESEAALARLRTQYVVTPIKDK